MKLVEKYENSDSYGWGPAFSIYELDSANEDISQLLEDTKHATVIARDVKDPTRVVVCYG